MDISFFTDKNIKPDDAALERGLGATYSIWKTIAEYVHNRYPGATDEWNYPGAKYGWSFRIRDKKRVIIYLLPRDGYFKAAFVFGEKAAQAVFSSGVNEAIRKELAAAKAYAEGRGIRIEVREESILADITRLIDIKLGY